MYDIAQFRNCTYLHVHIFKAPESVSTKAIEVIMRFPRLKKKITRKWDCSLGEGGATEGVVREERRGTRSQERQGSRAT